MPVVRESGERGIKSIALNPVRDRVQIDTAEPKYLEVFTSTGYKSDFEVEVFRPTDNVGYSFRRRSAVSTEVTESGRVGLKSFVSSHQSGYMFIGPPHVRDDYPDWADRCAPPDSSSRHFGPRDAGNTWCRADFVMSIGDTSGSQDSVAAYVVVGTPNGWVRWCKSVGYYGWSTDVCPCDTSHGIPPISVFKQQAVTSFGDTVWVDTLVLDSATGIWDTTKTLAWMRKVKVSDFSAAQTLDTISFNYLQLKDNPYRYQVYWTKKKDLFVDKIIISNAPGRRLFNIANVPSPEQDTAEGRLQALYNNLDSALHRWLPLGEPYGGSIPTMNDADDLMRSVQKAGSSVETRIVTNYNISWRGTRAYQDYMNTVSPPELVGEMFANHCNIDSTSWTSGDTINGKISRQEAFNNSIADMKDLYQRAKDFGKKFWMQILMQEFTAYDSACGKYIQLLRRPTEAELNAEAFLSLAYGAKGINWEHYSSYYNYGGPSSSCSGGSPPFEGIRQLESGSERVDIDPDQAFLSANVLHSLNPCAYCSTFTSTEQYKARGRGMVDWIDSLQKWVPNDKYRWVKKINEKLKKIGSTIMQLTWQDAGSITNASSLTDGLVTSALSSIYGNSDTAYVELAHFSNDHFMLVNRRVKGAEGQDIAMWLNKTGHSYVIDLTSGDTTLTGNTGSSGAPFTTHLDPGQGKLFKVVSAPQYVHGTVYHKAWQGKIILDGDVTVPNGKVVKILYPKAEIRFLANRDTLHSGYSTSKGEFVLYGGLLVTGIYGDSVKFISDAGSPGEQDWQGITVIASDPPDRLVSIDDPGGGGLVANGAFKVKFGVFKNAYAALDYQNTAPDTVKDCLFQNNAMYGIRSSNDSVKILNSRFLDHGSYALYLNAADDTVIGCYFKNNTYSINAYRSYGLLSNNTVLNSSGYFGEVGLQVDGYQSGQTGFLTVASCIDSGEFNQAALIANNRLKIQDSYIKTRATTPIPDPAPQNIAILGSGADVATVRHSTVKYSGYSSTIPLIKVTATPLLDLGTASDSGKNSITKAGKSKAVQNDVTSDSVPARYNYWGTSNPTSSLFTGKVAFVPYLSSAPAKLATGEEIADKTTLPSQFSLNQNYPNPFNPTTTISFALPVAEKVRLDIYNILGQKVKTLVDAEKPAGVHQVVWDGRDGHGLSVSSGLYFYKIETASFREVKRMVFLK